MGKSNSNINKIPYVPSEGEEFLMDFFRSEGIYFEAQKKIENLKGDIYSYRVADFYLPEYKVYVEFFGMWNVREEKKTDYREKKNIYMQNNIPCIYFYPENLGIIHYFFNKRLRAELKRQNLKKELFLFNLWLLVVDKVNTIAGFILCLVILILFQFDREAKLYWQSCAVIGSILIFLGYRIVKGYIKFFKKDYSYVAFAKE